MVKQSQQMMAAMLRSAAPPAYLHGDGLPGLLPVEDAAGLELGLQRVLVDGRLHRLALAMDDHVRVGTCRRCQKHVRTFT